MSDFTLRKLKKKIERRHKVKRTKCECYEVINVIMVKV